MPDLDPEPVIAVGVADRVAGAGAFVVQGNLIPIEPRCPRVPGELGEAARETEKSVLLGDHPLMMSAKFPDFSNPLPLGRTWY